MSSLTALLCRDGQNADPAAVRAMLAAAPYRAIDGQWVRDFGIVSLGFGKLAITPEELREQQPLVSPRTSCVVIADVRLDNREELLGRLPDSPPASTSDAEIILRVYETWGLRGFERLLGDFALVVWDPRQQRLIAARDTSGQRSLFYRADARVLAVASEIQQLLQDPSVPIESNDERILDFLVPLNMFRNEKDQAATFYRDIWALPAGHLLLADCNTLHTRRYWTFEAPAELRYRREEEYAEHYRSLFFDVVKVRLRSSPPVGALLSGGLDSSAVVSVAQEIFRAGQAEDRGFTSFSFVFDHLDCDERSLVEEVQAKYGFTARYISCGQFAGRLQLEPRGFLEAPNLGISEGRDALFGTACQSGVRALLTGDLADGCVGGSWLVFDSLLRRGQLRAFWQYFSTYRRRSDESLRKIIALYCLAPLLPLPLQRWINSSYLARSIARNQEAFLPLWIPEPLRQELVRRHRQLALEMERGRYFSNPTREAEFRILYPPEVARHPVPWPLEFWRPFADRRLHEFLLAIPPELKFAPHPESDAFYAGSKRLVRQAMRGILPESIRTRTSKTVFHGVLESEIKRQWPLYEAAFGPTGRSEIARRGYVDQQRFWSRLEAIRAGGPAPDIVYLMQLVGLETWLRALTLPRPERVTVPPPWNSDFPSEPDFCLATAEA